MLSVHPSTAFDKKHPSPAPGDAGESKGAASKRFFQALDCAVVAACIALALSLRYERLDAAAISSDVIGPYLKAWLIRSGQNFFPDGPFPESGYLSPYAFLPYVLFGSSLRSALILRYSMNALIVVFPLLGLRMLPLGTLDRRPLLAAAWPMFFLAAAPGLLDTLQTGFQTFDVPLYAGLPTLSALWLFFRRDPRALVLLVPAAPALAMLHPYALIYFPATLFAALYAWWIGGRRYVIWASLLAGLLVAPQLYRFYAISSGSPVKLMHHLSAIAGSNGAFPSFFEALLYAFRQEFWVRYPFPTSLFLLFPFAALPLSGFLSRRNNGTERSFGLALLFFTLWLGLLGTAFLGLAAWVRYVQPYHLRILYVPLALEASLVCTAYLLLVKKKAWFQSIYGILLLSLLASILLMVTRRAHFPPSRGSLLGHEKVTRLIESALGNRPVALEYLHLSNDLSGYPAAIILDLLLRGYPATYFLDEESDIQSTRFFMALTGEAALLSRLNQQAGGENIRKNTPMEGLLLLEFSGVRALRRWSRALCPLLPNEVPLRFGGANDYLGLLNPQNDIAAEGRWFDTCLWNRAK